MLAATDTQLIYNGEVIRDRNEMLSLTDMWKASGGDASKRPVEWLRGEQAQRFISFMAEDLGMGEVGKSHFGLVGVSKGGAAGGSTFAHWQIGLAYAKYLSPEFHMWCNSVVRERMEGKPALAALTIDAEMRRTIGGIMKSVVHKEIAEVLPQMVERALLEDTRVVTRDYRAALDVLKDRKVPLRGRRAFSQKVSSRLRRFSIHNGFKMRFGNETGRYLYHVDAIERWLAVEGGAMIADHIAAVSGQAVLPFRLHHRRKP